MLIGDLYYFRADDEISTVERFKGTGSTLEGKWQKIEVLDEAQAGKPGFDRFGYKDREIPGENISRPDDATHERPDRRRKGCRLFAFP